MCACPHQPGGCCHILCCAHGLCGVNLCWAPCSASQGVGDRFGLFCHKDGNGGDQAGEEDGSGSEGLATSKRRDGQRMGALATFPTFLLQYPFSSQNRPGADASRRAWYPSCGCLWQPIALGNILFCPYAHVFQSWVWHCSRVKGRCSAGVSFLCLYWPFPIHSSLN